MITFNEWMAHLYTEMGYPKKTIELYEQSTKSKQGFPVNQRHVIQDGNDAGNKAQPDNTAIDQDQ